MTDMIHRKSSKNNNIDYSKPVVIHETSKSRISFIPYYVKHTKHSEFCPKIQTYRKGDPPNEWEIVEEKSISFNETAIRKLLAELKKHLVVSREDKDGKFLLIELKDGIIKHNHLEPEIVAKALTLALSQKDILAHVNSMNLSDELVGALRNTIKLKDMQSAIIKLREYLNGSSDQNEKLFQEWCTDHSWVFGNSHMLVDSDTLNIGSKDELDMMLANVISHYRDIIEFKKPNVKVVNFDGSHHSYYFSAEVSKAIGQCHRYMDVLQKNALKGLDDHPEIVAYHPKATIVIGRSIDWNTEETRALHGLNSRLHGINIMTYDHLLSQGERLISMLTSENQ
jgi:Shedu protein SduA, C-terminal